MYELIIWNKEKINNLFTKFRRVNKTADYYNNHQNVSNFTSWILVFSI